VKMVVEIGGKFLWRVSGGDGSESDGGVGVTLEVSAPPLRDG